MRLLRCGGWLLLVLLCGDVAGCGGLRLVVVGVMLRCVDGIVEVVLPGRVCGLGRMLSQAAGGVSR